MKLGLLVHYQESDLALLHELGLECCELLVFPENPLSPTVGAGPDEWKRAREKFDELGVEVSAVGCYLNNLTPHPQERARILSHMEALFGLAQVMGTNLVGTFAGRNPTLAPSDNIPEFRKVFTPLVAQAEQRGMRIVIENCPMFEDTFLHGINFAYTPETWEMMFDAVPSLSLGLEFDPSHLVGLGIDPIRCIQQFRERIYHVHAKDAELLPDAVNRYGWQDPRASRHRTPGLGQLDWKQTLDTLREAGYCGNIDIEGRHDPVYQGETEKQGLRIAVDHLRPLL